MKQTEQEHPGPSPKAAEDPRLVAALEEYLAALEGGETPDRDRFLARHPEIAQSLAECLEGLEFIRTAASEVRQPAAASPTGAPSTDTFLPEGPLGDYRIVREVGRGGMGVVYEAVQISLGRRVALKVLPFAAALDPRQLQRFKNEAQAAAQLHHTNIVPVFGVGCDRGVHYYAMQFIDGQTAAALVREARRLAGLAEPDAAATPSPPQPGGGGRGIAADSTLAALATERSVTSPGYFRTVAQLGIQAAEALEHAHQLGIVHRDVKPANLLVDVRGNLWVTDFGLAQFHAEAGLTRTDDVLGTLRYMSPEQVRGRHAVVDHRTDVYSLGVTLYELLTLEPAFAATNRNELAAQIACEEPRPLRRLNKGLPAELETIVLKAMEKDPAERYATTQELADDLRCFLEDRTIRAKRPTLVQRLRKWAQRHRSLVRAAVAVLFVATVAALVSAALIGGAMLQARQERDRANQAASERAAALRQVDEQRLRAEKTILLALTALDEDYLQLVERQLPGFRRGRQPDRRVLERALHIHKQLVEYHTTDPGLRQAIGNGFRRVGDIQGWLGESREAERAYRQGIALLGQLAKEFPAVPRYRYELAGINDRLGLFLVNERRPREAEEPLRRSLALYEHVQEELAGETVETRLEALKPGNLPREEEDALRRSPARREKLAGKCWNRFRNELANNHDHLGQMFAATDRPREAEQAYRRALDLQNKLVDDDPTEPSFRFALACMVENRANLFRETGRPREAEQGYLRAQALLKQLVAELPGTPTCRQSLAMNWDSLGLLLEATGRRREAGEAFDRALELKQQLVTDFPDRTGYQYLLAVGRKEQGNRLEAANQPAEAEHAYRRALVLLDKLLAEDRDVAEHQYQLACSQSALAKLLVTTRQIPEAEKLLLQARDRYEKLRADTSLEVRPELASNQNTLGLVLEATGRAREARPVYEQAVALWEELADEHPRVASHHSNLGSTLANLARTLNALQEWEKAHPLAERAVGRQRVALQQKPGDAAYGRLLQDHYLILAESWLCLGKHEGAAQVAAEFVRAGRTSSPDSYVAADILVHCVPLVENDDRLSPAQRRAGVRDYVDRIHACLRDLDRQGAENPAVEKALARFLAVYALPGVGDPERALTMARRAIDRSPRDGTWHSVLGMALYRTGQWPAAVTALNKAIALRSGDGLDGFFLAMAHWRAGDKDKAALWYDRAAAWMAKHQPYRRDLRLIRAEAAALLGRDE
jgi:serine/threonine protein kinase/Flp pilus assembly protein TadD